MSDRIWIGNLKGPKGDSGVDGKALVLHSLEELKAVRESGPCVFIFPRDLNTVVPPLPSDQWIIKGMFKNQFSGEILIRAYDDGILNIQLSLDLGTAVLIGSVFVYEGPDPAPPLNDPSWSWSDDAIPVPYAENQIPVSWDNGTWGVRAGTPEAEINSVVMRDANGRSQFADPVEDADATTKHYVDSQILHINALADLKIITKSSPVIFHTPASMADVVPALPPAQNILDFPSSTYSGNVWVKDYDIAGYPGLLQIQIRLENGTGVLIGSVFGGVIPPDLSVPDPNWTFLDRGLPSAISSGMGLVSDESFNWISVPASTTAQFGSLVRRDGFGRAEMAPPVNPFDVTNKKYVDDIFINRAPFPPSVGTNKYLSVTSNAAWQQILVDTVNSANSVPQRKANGNIDVAITPVASTDAASKNYVDTTVAGPASFIAAPPATATSAGVKGTRAYDSDYLYICVATNVWKRTPLSTW